MDTETVTNVLQARTGGRATVVINDHGLTFTIDCGPRESAVGGFTGGRTKGRIEPKQIIPIMASGINPLTTGQWYKLLLLLDWF